MIVDRAKDISNLSVPNSRGLKLDCDDREVMLRGYKFDYDTFAIATKCRIRRNRK